MKSLSLILFASLAVLISTGCGQNAYTLHRQNQALATQQHQVAQRNTELQQRATSLDTDNQQLEGLLAQSQQQIQLLKDEVQAVRGQLRSTTGQLADLRNEKSGLQRQTEALAASVRRRAGASIRANNSYLGDLSAIHIQGVEVRQDGEVVRVELPGGKLFHPGSAALQPGAAQIIDAVMADMLRAYPDQVLGIEGHTDSVPIRTPQFPSNYHLSVARASAVFDHISRRYQLAPKQMFLAGHGPNTPVASNATPAGKVRNRRVELVVYPETYR